MPRMMLKVENQGNGIKTSIRNLNEVAKALRIPVDYPLKFFEIELGTITKQESGSYTVNGMHDGKKMEEILDK